MKILVTGGAGYIGSHVVKLLLENSDHEITILDNLVTGFQKTVDTLATIAKENGVNLNFIKEDLSDFKKIEKIMNENHFDAIIHFAASLVVPESVENPLKYYLNNTANTANLIKYATENGVKKFIFSSTAATYGEPDATVVNLETGLKESDPTEPINPYGMSKLMSERVLKDTAFANDDFKYAALRYFNVAGSDPDGRIGQSTENATLLIKVAAEAATGKRDKMYIFGEDYPTPDGTGIRDYIHVVDLAQAHIEALAYLEAHESDVFNVGYSRGFSVKEVIDTMKKVSGVDFTVEIKERRAGDPAILISDNTKIKNAMHWQPRYDDLEVICQTTLEWEKKI
ncbi:UDP-glucose 4-epimerase GalE [Sulfurovum sp. TSL1]|uniref:UDP-glucose 4-epimerase GalE n=1 Tax=Sulfurovum sp. TSL1 TaxID=2826994 RepID=UPI001CC33FD9|nr:UDP-glucose 4-epimerase GalE [Sulfurovum sp. TSL1]GIT98143.1 UDP-glucose 4-epimerase [Sulfurovum sp. TSL1]